MSPDPILKNQDLIDDLQRQIEEIMKEADFETSKNVDEQELSLTHNEHGTNNPSNSNFKRGGNRAMAH